MTDLKPIASKAAWLGSQIDYRAEGLHQLSAADLDEIAAGLRELQARGGPDFPDITAENFPLPHLGARLAALRDDLRYGRGFILLRGLSTERFDADDMARILYGLGAHLGTPTPQSWQGEMLGNVIDVSDVETQARGYHKGGGQRMHCDSCDIVALMCLREAVSGGVSRIASAVAVHDRIVAERPELARVLYTAMPYHRMDLDAQYGTGLPSRGPVTTFAVRDGEFSCYLSTVYATRGAGGTLPAEVKEALDMIESLASSPEFYLDMNIRAGDIQFLNNRLLLHGRTNYQDAPDIAARRHMLRLWLRVPDWPELTDAQRVHASDDHRLWLRQREPRMEVPSRYLAAMTHRKEMAAAD